MAESRDQIAEAVHYGRMKPEEAEQRLSELGLPPLSPQLDLADFDPMEETWWTLPMAVSWISWRSIDDVREVWDRYRTECPIWRYRDWHVGGDPGGWALEAREPATIAGLRLREVYDRVHAATPLDYTTVEDALTTLWKALGEGDLEATGIERRTQARAAIPSAQWRDLVLYENHVPMIVSGHDRFTGPWYKDVVFPRRRLLAIWPHMLWSNEPAILPPTLAPIGSGYMPLYCAAQWIATKGGSLNFDPKHVPTWQAAYDHLLARIAAEEVIVTGVRNGTRAKIEGYTFAGIRVNYPFEDPSYELIRGDELYLLSFPYVDDEHWHKEFDDALTNRQGRQWEKLMVLKSDVRKIWPFATEDEAWKSGAPGRPSAMQLVEQEHSARWERGEAEETITAEAKVLSAWLRKTHPHAPRLTPKTIKNGLSAEHRRRKNARK